MGAKLRKRREVLGLTIQDVARQTGMFDKQIVALESDDHGAYMTDKNHLTRLLMLYARKIQLELEPLETEFIGGAKKNQVISKQRIMQYPHFCGTEEIENAIATKTNHYLPPGG